MSFTVPPAPMTTLVVSCSARPFLRTTSTDEPLPAYALPFARRTTRVVPGSAMDATYAGGSTLRPQRVKPYEVAAQRSEPSMATSRNVERKGSLWTSERLHCAETGRARNERKRQHTHARMGAMLLRSAEQIESYRNVIVHCYEDVVRDVYAEVGHVHVEARGGVNAAVGDEHDAHRNGEAFGHAVQGHVAGDVDVDRLVRGDGCRSADAHRLERGVRKLRRLEVALAHLFVAKADAGVERGHVDRD